MLGKNNGIWNKDIEDAITYICDNDLWGSTNEPLERTLKDHPKQLKAIHAYRERIQQAEEKHYQEAISMMNKEIKKRHISTEESKVLFLYSHGASTYMIRDVLGMTRNKIGNLIVHMPFKNNGKFKAQDVLANIKSDYLVGRQ